MFRDPKQIQLEQGRSKTFLTSIFSQSKTVSGSQNDQKLKNKLDLTDVKPVGFIPFYLFEIDQDSDLLESELDSSSEDQNS